MARAAIFTMSTVSGVASEPVSSAEPFLASGLALDESSALDAELASSGAGAMDAFGSALIDSPALLGGLALTLLAL